MLKGVAVELIVNVNSVVEPVPIYFFVRVTLLTNPKKPATGNSNKLAYATSANFKD